MLKVIICGLGAVGLTFASKINHKNGVELKILADENRIKKFEQNPPKFNGVIQKFDYILPSASYDADLIIIATKFDGLESAIRYIKNFVSPKTRIISLINGISSEPKILETYKDAKVLKSYFIGHSAVRENDNVTQDGVAKIVTERDEVMDKFFELTKIDHDYPDDIDYSMWLKYTLNIYSNQASAILNLTFGDMKHSAKFTDFSKKVIAEVKSIAQKYGIKNLENLEKDCFNAISMMCDEGKTSMLQDILAKRKTEVDMFAGEIIRLGKQYGIPTPYNQFLYDLIKIKEEANEHSVYSR